MHRIIVVNALMLALVVAMMPLSAHAAITYSSVGKITRVEALTSAGLQGFYIRLNVTIPNPNSCINTTDAQLIKSDHADAERLFVMALGAYSAGKDVVVGIDGCSNGYPKLVYLRLQT